MKAGFNLLDTKLIKHFAALAAIVILAAGCGDGGNESGATATAAAPGGSSLAISGTPPSQIMQGSALNFAPTVSNPDNLTLSFTASNLPGWASINSSTGRITGTPGPGNVGVYSNIRLTVSGGGQSVTTPAYSITVVATATGSALLSWVPPTQNTDGSPLTDLAGHKVYWGLSPSNLNNTVTLNGAGITSYVVNQLTPATWYFATTAFDVDGMESGFSNIASKTVM